jgi:hypothetical protein
MRVAGRVIAISLSGVSRGRSKVIAPASHAPPPGKRSRPGLSLSSTRAYRLSGTVMLSFGAPPATARATSPCGDTIGDDIATIVLNIDLVVGALGLEPRTR